MKKNISLFVLLLLLVGVEGQASEKITPSKTIVRKEVKVSNFTEILTSSAIDVVYTPSSSVKVIVEAPDNVMPFVSVKVDGNKLVAKYNRNNLNFKGNPSCKVIVEAPGVKLFDTNSAGSISITNKLDVSGTVKMYTRSAGAITAKDVVCDDFVGEVNSAGGITIANISAIDITLNTNSAGNINVSKAKADNIKCTASSAGKINISGNCASVSLTANSAGDINASGLKAATVKAVTNSIGSIQCHVTESLDAQCNSLGKIRYKGSPSVYRASAKGVSRL